MSVAKVIGPDIEELIRENPQELAAAVKDLHPADIAELLSELSGEDRLVLFEALPPDQGAAVLSELKGEALRSILHQASPDILGPRLDRVPARRVSRSFWSTSPNGSGRPFSRRFPSRCGRGEETSPLRAPHGRPSHVREVRKVRPEWTVAETLEHLKKIDRGRDGQTSTWCDGHGIWSAPSI